MHRLKLIPVGENLAAELPPDIVARHGLKAGDDLVMYATDEGWKIAIPGTPLDEQLRAGLRIMADHREVLSQLAKS
ncbi:AbrB/MazE/SpoVT family DNA-binding domain-containing protein [Ramlibacter sp. WS9]|uniref:AbrB/MazE/SpoVT family DNA-binding domain-containing protein n=1 Tax=Ramlibacter sp. WS9 TaxID=1882741 RepID=UPI001144D8D9|nr:AbrB/MazE/SpoVT family DNA-binding domain-containing protein [Ramlibacter sp. WS9]